jgi:hypothetical protein
VTSFRQKCRGSDRSRTNQGEKSELLRKLPLSPVLRPPACIAASTPSRPEFTLASKEASVLHKCANPVCPNQFRSLSHGKLFLVQTDRWAARADEAANGSRRGRLTRQVERYWLCDCCSSLLTLTFEPGRGMVTVPFSEKNSPPPQVHLRDSRGSVNRCGADRG